MCNVLLRDPLQRLWQLSVQDDATLMTTLTGIVSPTADPVLISQPSVKLTADVDGTIIATSINATPNYALPFIAMQAPGGQKFKLTFDSTNLLVTAPTTAATPISTVPRPLDVSMSQFPDSVGVICPKCASASVTVSGDFSCWCCVCSTFVVPEDTTIVVVLDE